MERYRMSDLAAIDVMMAKAKRDYRQGNRRTGLGAKSRERPIPLDALEFVTTGGMRRLEHHAAFHAAKRAVEDTRHEWLTTLMSWRDREDDAFIRIQVDQEIERLRRALALLIPSTDDERRAQTRERVRRHRAKRNAPA